MGSLLANEAVQKELGLEGAVLEKAKALSMEYYVELQNVVPREPSGLHSLPFAEAVATQQRLVKQVRAAVAMVAASMKPRIQAALSVQQYQRLQQIHWQAAGLTVLRDPEFAPLLGISKEQSARFAAIEKEYNDKLVATGETTEGRGSIRDEAQSKMRQVLTPDQHEKWTQLKGKEFDVASLRNTRRNRRP